MVDASQDSAAGRLVHAWDDFWFAGSNHHPQPSVAALRAGVCLVAALWLLSFLPTIDTWFSKDGLLSVEISSRFVDFEESPAWAHWSPLWLTDQAAWYRAYVIVGSLIAAVAATGWGGRSIILVLLILCIGWVHRITWLQGTFEPLLIPFLAYLAIPSKESKQAGAAWQGHLTVRLFQTHWWMVFCVGLLSQLAHVDWWRGDAAWWLAAHGRSHLLTLDRFNGQPLLVNGLTHLMIAVQTLTLWWLLVPAARWLGLLTAAISLLCIALLADQTLYAMLLAAGLIAYLPTSRAADNR